ncbi:MAG: TatD DNase family protein [Aliidongia sp.]|jgi:TatD DNase family protein|nr:TatD DNase family protein [Aliidongia sp.]
MSLVDSHCHLDYPDFAEERDAVIARARAAGVGTMVTICTKITEFDTIRAIAESDPDIWCTLGIHPHEAAAEPWVDEARLTALANHPKVVGIGECGLDYHYDYSPRDRQADVFRTHARAAREAGLPLIVHTREADDDTAALLIEESDGGRLTGVLHCFTSGLNLALRALDFGFYISFSGIVTFKNAEELREVVRAVPLERMLVETDAPFLAPVPKRGKRNEPAFVAHTAAFIAGLKGVSPDELARTTTDNFHRLFPKARRAPCG